MANKNDALGEKQICQHRQEYLKNVVKQFFYLGQIQSKAQRDLTSVSEQDIQNLKFQVLDKCIDYLNRYVESKKHKSYPSDPMISHIDGDLISFSDRVHIGTNETNWLSSKLKLKETKISGIAESISGDFDMTSISNFQISLKKFRSHLRSVNIDCTHLPSYLNTIELILVSATLVMEDGLKHYKKGSSFSVNSIKAGADLFVQQANRFLELAGIQEMISL
jgi:hypothetical protein